MGDRAILVTGFEPFGGETINASWEATRALDRWRCGDFVAHAVILPVAYEACVADFVAAFERLQPAAVLMTGQAARRGLVSVERYAHNRARAVNADSRGVVLGAATRSEAERLEANAPVRGVARGIWAAGVPTRVSIDAGDYVCNHLYFGALNFLAGSALGAPAVFVHLPATPEQTLERANVRRLPTADAARALQAAASVLAQAVPRLISPLEEAAQ